MADFNEMSVQRLRELARKVIGPGHSRLKTKSELVAALEEAGARPPAKEPGSRVRAAASRVSAATGKAVRAAKAAAGLAAKRATKATSSRAAEVASMGAAAAAGAVAGAKAAKPSRKAGKVARAAATAAGAAVGAAVGAAAGLRRKRRTVGKPAGASADAGRRDPSGPDPEGYFVARVRGEDAVRGAPHPMREDEEDTSYEEGLPPTAFDEGLGDLPWSYGDDVFVALPRDPHTLYVFWDQSGETLDGGFVGLDHPRAQLWLFARSGAGWERLRVVELDLESRGYYLHDLDPGRVYRAELHAVDRLGRERLLGRSSNEIGLPTLGPSPEIDDRFIRIPWDVPLGRLLGPGHAGGPFSEEARAMLARLSDWSRFTSKAVWGGSAGAPGERPSSPTSAPSSPASPAGPGER